MQHHLRFLAPLLLAAACSHPAPSAAPVTNTEHVGAATPAIGIAVVFEMQHLWLGNDTWWQGREVSRTEGWYGDLQDALDQLARVDLPGAQVVLVGYGEGASKRWTGPLSELTGDRLGTQASMTSVTQSNGNLVPNVGLDVTAGVEEAIADLDQMGVQEKHLIVVGDGNNADALAAERTKLDGRGITAVAIFLEEGSGALPGDLGGWKKLTDDIEPLESGDALGPTFTAIATRWKRGS